jgi:site-specific DNA recombinase
MKAVLYIRVSSSKQVGNTSAGTQEALCRKWCEEHELDVDRVFVEQGESAKTEDRTEFQRMFRYLDTVHDRISHVVVWKFDRLFRNSEDTAIYRRRLRGLGVKDVSVTERIEDDANGQFQRVILSAVDELDNANRSKRSFVSMKATFKAGRWVWTPPVGYISASKPLQCLQIDPVRGPMVVKMFEMIATGEATKANALAHLTRLGLTTVRGKALNQQSAARVLTNGLYCGRMFAKKWNLTVKGDYAPLISEDLFDRVQAVLRGRAAVPVPHKRQNEDFPMRGTLRCNVCNSIVTGSKPTGKMGLRFPKGSDEREKYRYRVYHCFKSKGVKGHFSGRAEKVEGALEALLMKLEPEPERLAAVVAVFRAVWNERTAVADIEVKAMKAQLKKLETKEARLLDSLSEGVTTNAQFKRASGPLLTEMEDIRTTLASQKFDVLDVDDAVSYLESMFWNLLNLWQSNNLDQKSSMLKLLFPDGVIFNSGVLEPNSTNSFFIGLADEKVDENSLVSPKRFELSLSP